MESVYWHSLVEVARSGSISSAAAALGVTQSAVSRRLKFLEDHYDAQLLERSASGVSLTAQGRFVVARARSILALEADLAAGVREGGAGQAVRFGCTQGWAALYLSHLVDRSGLAEIGAAELRLTFAPPGELEEAFVCGALDVAVIDHDQPLQLPSARLDPLPSSQLALVSHPSLGLAAGVDSLAALLAHPVIVRRPGCCSRVLLERDLAFMGAAITDFASVHEVGDFLVQRALVESGQGISLLPRPLVEDALRSGSLVEHTLAGFKLSRLRTLVSCATAPAEGAPARLRDLVVEAAWARFPPDAPRP
jgi:DNA-binding transcriptional LysR family regulator